MGTALVKVDALPVQDNGHTPGGKPMLGVVTDATNEDVKDLKAGLLKKLLSQSFATLLAIASTVLMVYLLIDTFNRFDKEREGWKADREKIEAKADGRMEKLGEKIDANSNSQKELLFEQRQTNSLIRDMMLQMRFGVKGGPAPNPSP